MRWATRKAHGLSDRAIKILLGMPRVVQCEIVDDMSQVPIPMLLQSDAIVLGSPVYFDHVSAQLEAFIYRTGSIRGGLRNDAILRYEESNGLFPCALGSG